VYKSFALTRANRRHRMPERSKQSSRRSATKAFRRKTLARITCRFGPSTTTGSTASAQIVGYWTDNALVVTLREVDKLSEC